MDGDTSDKLVDAALESVERVSPLPILRHVIGMRLGNIRADAGAQKRIEKGLRSLAPGASSDNLRVALTQSEVAVEMAHLDADVLVAHHFSAERLAALVRSRLDRTVDGPLRDLTEKAISLRVHELLSAAMNDGTAVAAYLRAAQTKLEEIDRKVEGLGRARSTTTPWDISREEVDRRRLADPTHSDLFLGDHVDLVFEHLGWNWRNEIEVARWPLHRLMQGSSRKIREAIQTINAIALTETYPQIWRQLQAQRVTESLEKLLRATPPPDPKARDAEAQERTRLRDGLTWLRKQKNEPEFGLVVPIVGSWGAGKSRTLDQIAEACQSRFRIPVHCDLNRPGDLRTLILESLTYALGLQAGTVKQLELELTHALPIVLIVDNWEAALSLDRTRRPYLEALIQEMSGLDATWVIASDESALPDMLGSNGYLFWRRYGIGERSATRGRKTAHALRGSADAIISGWLQLDRVNEIEGLGIQIVEHHNTISTPELALIRRGVVGTKTTRRELSRPLIALLRLQSDAQVPLDVIHLASLLENYWRLLASALVRDSPTLSVETVVAACDGIAQSLLAGGSATSSELPFLAAPPRGVLAEDWPHSVRAALRLLSERRVVDVRGKEVWPARGLDLLWGYLVARQGQHPSPTSPEWYYLVADLADLSSMDVDAGTEALRFVLLDAAVSASNAPESADLKPYQHWLSVQGLPKSALWEAAPNLPPGMQHAVIKAGLRRWPEPPEAFWAIRLIRLMDVPESSQALNALLFTSRFFPFISDAGIPDYLLSSLRTLIPALDWSSRDDAIRSLNLLAQMDQPSLSEPVAAAILASVTLADPESRRRWISILMEFLGTAEPTLIEGTGQTFQEFWEALCRQSLKALAESAGPIFFEELVNEGWYVDPRTRRGKVARTMRHETHVQLGHTYGEDQRFHEPFRAIIECLLRHGYDPSRIPPQAQSEAALFGIRHTEVTRSYGSPVRVHSSLADLVALAEQDVHLRNQYRGILDRLTISDTPSRVLDGPVTQGSNADLALPTNGSLPRTVLDAGRRSHSLTGDTSLSGTRRAQVE